MKPELCLVGGGLANSLIALRILADEPDYPLLMLERGTTVGGNHTWSFHDSDLTTEHRRRLDPLVVAAWPRHEVRFPHRRRTIDGGYCSVSSTRLDRIVRSALGPQRLRLGAEVSEVGPSWVRLSDGDRVDARAVIDGRGDPGGEHLELGFQKFVGLFVRLDRPHRLDGPILMDATVEQVDGYRFIYTLPFAADELLIEDTVYSDGPGLDGGVFRDRVHRYAADMGWSIAEVVGDEAGVLPIVLGGDIDGFWNAGPHGVARSGMRGGFFHPTTGYSLPEAAALADAVAAARGLDGSSLHRLTHDRSLELWRRTGYYRLLNRMLFRAAEPSRRVRIFERFYGLPEALIRRFYAGRLKWRDKLRLLTGRPPVPILAALKCLAPGSASRGSSG